jgi:hypothetical protein
MTAPRPAQALVLALALAGSFATSPAWAQLPTKGAPKAAPPAPPPPAAKGAPAEDEAAKSRADGLKLLKAGKWEDARVLLAHAYKLAPTWQNALDLGRAELGAEKPRDAAEHLYAGLRDAGRALSDADRKAAETLFATVQTRVAALRFEVKPEGAELFVGGQSVGKAPLASPIFVLPGPTEVEVRLDGYTAIKTTKQADVGEETPVEVELKRAKQGDLPPPRPPEGPLRGVSMPLLIGGAAGTGALALLGGALAIVSDVKASKSHGLERPDATCGATCKTDFDALQKQKVTFAGASMWSFIGAGALLVGTASYTVVTILKRPKEAMRADVVITPGQLGATFSGRF